MCVAIICMRCLGDHAVFIASNRDEYYDRPTAPPQLTQSEGVRCLAPRDLRAGGTWIGMTEHGVFALLANRSDLAPLTPTASTPSRGLLVRDALGARSLDEAVARITRAPLASIAPFHLVLGNPQRAFLITNEARAGWTLTEWGDGVHVISDRGRADDPRTPVVAAARRLWDRERALIPAADVWSTARTVLAPRDGAAEDPAAVFRSGIDRGTVATTLIAVDERGSGRMLYADTTRRPITFATHSFLE